MVHEIKSKITANVIPFSMHDGKIYLLTVQEGSVGEEKDEKWSSPGGWIEKGETEIETACRELYEETSTMIRVIDSEFYCRKRLKKGTMYSPYCYFITKKELIPYARNPMSASYALYIPYSKMQILLLGFQKNEEIVKLEMKELNTILKDLHEYRDCFVKSLDHFLNWLEATKIIQE